MSRLKVLALTGLLTAIGIQTATADDQYPCKPAPDIDTWWYKIQKMDQTYPVKRNLGPHTFEIPYGYFTGRLTPERVNCTPNQDSLEFAFWLPDLRSPKKDMWYDANYRPQEEGRVPPGPHDFVVKVLSMKFIDTAKGESESPSIAFSNGLPSEKIIRLERKYELLHVLPETLGMTDDYSELSQRDYKITMRCTSPRSGAVNPGCKTYLYFTDLQLGVLLLFPADALPQWQKVKDGLRTFVQQWLVKK